MLEIVFVRSLPIRRFILFFSSIPEPSCLLIDFLLHNPSIMSFNNQSYGNMSYGATQDYGSYSTSTPTSYPTWVPMPIPSYPNHPGYLGLTEPRKSDSKNPVVVDAIPGGFKAINPKDTEFDVVSGRFGMTTNQKSYQTTVEEMKRRIEGPEKLNSSNMACNLKRPKLRNGGDLMRTQLRDRGVELMLNCRQVAFPNKLIPLVEAEAINLGHDLGTLVDEDYPVEDIAKEVAMEAKNKNELADKTGFLECMESLESVFTSVVPPMTGIMPVPSDNKDLNRSMEQFSCVTHGLGIVTSRMWVRQMKEVGKKLTEEVEKEAAYSIPGFY
uniref:TF_AP-2 domain-containing protein n=2 Tax=Caenorhabditis tropicalis TaxID=1561998 RepID=A0A1I7U4M4_9PELO